MEWALDLFGNKQMVHASYSTVNRNHQYLCPNCHAPVQLRKGPRRQPYFAHVSGRADPSCELYMPMLGNGTISENSIRERPSRSLGLYLRLLDTRKIPYSWQLEIGIPEPDSENGKLKFPFAWGGERIIPVHSIGVGGKRIPIRPRTEVYYISCEGVSEGNWANRIQQPIPGINTIGITLFRYSPMGGRRLAEGQPLYWGRAYVMIWKERNEPNLLVHPDRLVVRPLHKWEQWSGAFIKLPVNYDREVESWVKHWMERAVEYPPAELALVSPMPLQRLVDGSLIVPLNTEVIISIVGEEGTQGWTEVLISAPNSEKIKRFKGGGAIPCIFSIGCLQPGRTDIWLNDNPEEGLQLIGVTDRKPSGMFRGITLHGKKVDDDKDIVTSFYSSEAKLLLQQVREKKVELNAIDIPNGAKLTIRWKLLGQGEWNEWTTDNGKLSKGDDLAGSIISRLLELLDQPQLSIEIDAGGFGKIELDSVYKEINGKVSMSRKWRERAKWLLSQSRMFCGGVVIHPEWKRKISIKDLEMETLHQEDQRLLKKLVSHCTWPQNLEPQVRAVLNEWYQIRKTQLSHLKGK